MEALLFLPLAAIGFAIFSEHPLWILLFIGLNVVAMLVSYAFYRRQKSKVKTLVQIMTKGFLVLAGVFIVSSFIAVGFVCAYMPDPFCVFAAGPFFASALTSGLFAGIAHLIDWVTKKKRPATPRR